MLSDALRILYKCEAINFVLSQNESNSVPFLSLHSDLGVANSARRTVGPGRNPKSLVKSRKRIQFG